MFIYRLVAWRMVELHANFSRIFHTTLTHCISISITITKSDCNCHSYKARLKCYQLDVRSHSDGRYAEMRDEEILSCYFCPQPVLLPTLVTTLVTSVRPKYAKLGYYWFSDCDPPSCDPR